jgi:thiol-disulfide isomerase/thioredoxin
MFLGAVVHADEIVREFSFKTVDGKTVEYKATNKSPFVVNIGAHWWPECKKEAPELQKAYQAYSGKGVKFLGVFVMSSDSDIRKFVETFKVTFPVGRENGIAERLGVRGIPVTVFLDKNGKIVRRHIGVVTYADLSSNIETILK